MVDLRCSIAAGTTLAHSLQVSGGMSTTSSDPASDEKGMAHLLVAQILSETIQKLGLKYPELTPTQHQALVECRAQLEAERD